MYSISKRSLTNSSQILNRKKVCVIGGGPAGIMAVSILKDHCDVDCFERANEIGGQWGVNTDEFCKKHYGTRHSSLYKGLWTNVPKEYANEVPNYPWPEATASFVSADHVRKYLFGYADAFGVSEYIKTSHAVEALTYADDIFSVTVKNVETDTRSTGSYNYVCVATGHFHYPNNPSFEGEETFSGELLHAHDFTDGANYAGKRVLCIGGSYSAEDICLLCKKNGATYSHVSTREPGGFGYVDWPEGVLERPGMANISGSTVTFTDGKSDDYDVIIKCTGYVHKFDFLPAELDIHAVGNATIAKGLYKQCISIENPKLFFIGMSKVFSNWMFQLQAYLLRETILERFTVPDKAERQAGSDEDLAAQDAFTSVFTAISFQTNYMNHLSEITNQAKCDTEHIRLAWIQDKAKSIQKFRTSNYASIHTGDIGSTIYKPE